MQDSSHHLVTTYEQIASEDFDFDYAVPSPAVGDDCTAAELTEGGPNSDRASTFRLSLLSRINPIVAADNDVDVEECVTALIHIMSSDLASKKDTLGLWARRAKEIMDALQGWIDEKPLGHEFPGRAVFYLLVKLSAASDELPPSLFINGVDIGRDRDPVRLGGCADIFKGSYQKKDVAVKRLRMVEGSKAQLQSKFRKEALIWRQLKHPYLLPFLGVDAETFASTDFLCMVSPWMELGTMESFLKKSQHYHPKRDGDRLLWEVALGLVYLHSQKVVHGDVNWVNVLIDDNLHARIADFGLTSVGEFTKGGLKATSGAVGTIRWMSPERMNALTDTRQLPECDVYAFGCLCLALYTQQQPFPRLSELGVMREVDDGKRPDRPIEAEYHGIQFSDEMWDLVERCWAHEPKDRPSMQDVAHFFQPSFSNSTIPHSKCH